jgi:hypothetical protein
MRVVDEGEKSYDGELSLGKNDELGNANLQVTRCNQTSPKDGHVASTDLAIPNEFRAEPKPLNEHCHRHKLCSRTRRAPDSIKLRSRPIQTVQHLIECALFERGGIEGFYG